LFSSIVFSIDLKRKFHTFFSLLAGKVALRALVSQKEGCWEVLLAKIEETRAPPHSVGSMRS
jgi:hypothetical protein